MLPALTIAVWVAAVDLTNVEIDTALGLLVGGVFLLGLYTPRLSLIAGVIAGLGIPAGRLIAEVVGFQTAYAVELPYTLLPVPVAILAALLGKAARPVIDAMWDRLR